MMKSWIISIVCVVVLTVIFDLLLAEGATKKYIKGIMSVIVIAVIIAPLPGLLKKEIEFTDAFQQNQELSKDGDLLFRLYTAQYSQKERQIEEYIEEKGISGCQVSINFSYDMSTLEIISVLVSVENAVISEKGKNINISEVIIEAVQKAVSVNKERIMIYGKDI